MPKTVNSEDRMDNRLIREAVLHARSRGEISLSGLAREVGYIKPNSSLIKRMLGINEYVERYNGGRRRTEAISRPTAHKIWRLISNDEPNFETAPIGWGNGSDMVMVDPIRKAVEQAVAEKRITYGKIATELGYVTPDDAPLRRALGLKKESGKTCKSISYDLAVWLTHRLGLDPHETGV